MRPHPEDGVESWLLVAVDCLVSWGEVLVLEQLTTVWRTVVLLVKHQFDMVFIKVFFKLKLLLFKKLTCK